MRASEPFKSNAKKLLDLLDSENLDVLTLLGKSNITYATGIREPSGALVISRNCPPTLVTPLLDYHRILLQAPSDVRVVAFYRGGEKGVESDIPRRDIVEGGIVEAILKVAGECGERKAADLSTSSHTLGAKLAHAGFDDLTDKILDVRARKSSYEVELITEAARLAEKAFSTLVKLLDSGMSEAEAAAIIYREIVAGGGWGEAFPTIVAFYDNTALPHHTPGAVRLGVEGPVLVDWGAIVKGYRSDTTRTFWWGSNSPEKFQEILETVAEAVNAALDVLSPGVEAWEVDNAARVVLSKKKLSKYFIHGLGHGVGVDIHEKPYLRPGSKEVLEPGMIVTIEPGVYLPGLFGVRIENLVEVTAGGFRQITALPLLIP